MNSQESYYNLWTLPLQTQASVRTWQPKCDVVEDNNHFLISLEMAGIPKDQIRIDVIHNQLVVAGERKHEEGGRFYSERAYGKFQRSFALPTGSDTEKIEADYQDGVLRIVIPKLESAKPRQIRIGSSQQPNFFGKWIGQSSTKEIAS